MKILYEFKHYWKFITGLIILPLIIVFLIFFSGNSSYFWFNFFVSICSGFMTTGVIYVFVDKKLEDLLSSKHSVQVILKSETSDRKIELSAPIPKPSFSRSEVLGYIGMLQMKKPGSRYDIKYTSSPDFFKSVNKIYREKGDQEMIIKCTDEELDQFEPVK